MSDRIEELSELYRKNVLEDHERRIGLFTIPEYPELEAERGMLSSALTVFLTTLRYLAPAALLTLFWGQQSFLFRLIKYIDSAFKSLFQSTDEQKEIVLQWISDAGTVRVEKLETVWRHGWILCGALDIALPGSCQGHPPKKLSIKHAQSIAESYLGVEPKFSQQELETIETLAKHQEWKFIEFLDNIRIALEKLKPPISKASALKNSPEGSKFTFDYIARGSGLVAAQINNKAYFKIYPMAQQTIEPGEITVSIHGPENSYGMIKIPPILGKAEQLRKELLKHTKTKFIHTKTENALPITQGATYFRSFGKNDMSKTYYIPQTRCNIKMDKDNQQDYVKIGYTVEIEGKYEISITSKNRHIPGSPFQMTGTTNVIEILEKDNFCLEDGEQINLVEDNSDKKVVVRIVHFGNEKMILRENGTLEKISDDEEKNLIESEYKKDKNTDIENSINCAPFDLETKLHVKSRFYTTARKIVIMCKVIKAFHNYKKQKNIQNPNTEILLRSHKHIPDIVNSTFNDNYMNSNMLLEKRDRYIVPENISVSILSEKPEKNVNDFNPTNIPTMFRIYKNVMLKEDNLGDKNLFENNSNDNKRGPDNIYKYDMEPKDNEDTPGNIFEDNTSSLDAARSSINPFLTDTEENYATEKKFGSFIMSEYETNNLQNEEMKNVSTTLVSEHQPDLTLQTTNPFSDKDFTDSSTIDVLTQNPFLTDDNSSIGDENLLTDFIIGAPVSLPHHIISPSEINISQEIATKNDNSVSKIEQKPNIEILSAGKTSKVYTGALDKPPLIKKVSKDSVYNSSESIAATTRSSSISPKKEMRDSAYVSIDDNNSSSEMIHESLFDTLDKQKLPILAKISDMVERGYWDESTNIPGKEDKEVHDVSTMYDLKRSTFTPIKEENDKYYRNIKDDLMDENDSVTDAFAELDDIYDDYFTNSGTNYLVTDGKDVITSAKLDYVLNSDDDVVNSASEIITDVKRQPEKLEGKISEVQANVTESFSASQDLHQYDPDPSLYLNSQDKELTQFGDKNSSNIVLEKKRYWDEKIRQIEARTEESKAQSHKKRACLKYTRRNDSLTKRKGRKIVENFLKSNEGNEKQVNDADSSDTRIVNTSTEKKNKHNNELNMTHDFKHTSTSADYIAPLHTSQSIIEISPPYLKQELSEQVFKAFETSPKRFFGTSRQHILNKIDTFLGTPDTDEKTLAPENIKTHETGLVSSRISLFHNISKTEPLPWARKISASSNKTSVKTFNILKSSEKQIDMNNYTNKIYHKKVAENNKKIFQSNLQEKSVAPNPKQVKKEQMNYNLKEKRASFAEPLSEITLLKSDELKENYHDTRYTEYNKSNNLRTYKSKSELDIFNKVSNYGYDDLEKHKSCEELVPKMSVKKFISLFEDVAKPLNTTTTSKSKSGFQRKHQTKSSGEGTETTINTASNETCLPPNVIITTNPLLTTEVKGENKSTNSYSGFETISNQDQENCLSDIEIEIIETPDKPSESPKPENGAATYVDYKSRFKQAKQYFQSLEELRDEKNVSKIILDKSDEYNAKKGKSKRKTNIKKSHSMPSPEICKIWNQMHEENKESLSDTKKLVKISEKFNVDDLFEDVMEGRLSRQGSLRGIPHKKAVLETFRSMESVSDKTLNSYELVISQESDLLSENKNKNAQTYLSEYPYLPTTDPSKFHSRLDTNASGLITFKELTKTKPRRSSVPDIRKSPLFSADLGQL